MQVLSYDRQRSMYAVRKLKPVPWLDRRHPRFHHGPSRLVQWFRHQTPPEPQRFRTLLLSVTYTNTLPWQEKRLTNPISIFFTHTSTSHCHLGRHHGPCIGFTAASLGSNRHFGQKYRDFADRNLLLGSDHQYLLVG
jgi:hypothetical protein